MKFLRKKFLDFLYTNPFLRKVNVIISHNIIPLIIRFFLILITLIIFIVIALKLFWPSNFDKISSKASSYFYYYFRLSVDDFSKINISGNKRTQESEIIEIVNLTQGNFSNEKDFRYQVAVKNLIDDIRSRLHWVKEVTISRSLPNTLNIALIEYEPFAIWQSSEVKYIIDRDGNTIPFEDIEGLEKMIILSGSEANIHARSLFNIFTIDSDLSRIVYSATWVGNRRWDIRFENGLLIKLPENDIANAWQNLIKIYNMPGSIIGLKVIDLRIKDKIYLEYEDSAMKELQKI
jgi:cell division septal protein FtsQ